MSFVRYKHRSLISNRAPEKPSVFFAAIFALVGRVGGFAVKMNFHTASRSGRIGGGTKTDPVETSRGRRNALSRWPRRVGRREESNTPSLLVSTPVEFAQELLIICRPPAAPHVTAAGPRARRPRRRPARRVLLRRAFEIEWQVFFRVAPHNVSIVR